MLSVRTPAVDFWPAHILHYVTIATFVNARFVASAIFKVFSHIMRFSFFLLLLLGSLALLPPVAADILDTKHNLMGGQPADEKAFTAEEKRVRGREVCVFCHTPGVAELAEVIAGTKKVVTERPVARWQKSVEATFTFELFDDIGRMGAEGTGVAPVGSVSVACLSCHDGTQALAVSQGTSSDHPFGVPYRGLSRSGESASKFRDRIISASTDVPAQAARFIGDDSDFRPARSGVVNKRQIWWAALTDNGQRTKSDLPLYPRRVDGAGGYEAVPFVECTSCHDPHVDREVFLRMANEQGKLCLTCHVK